MVHPFGCRYDGGRDDRAGILRAAFDQYEELGVMSFINVGRDRGVVVSDPWLKTHTHTQKHDNECPYHGPLPLSYRKGESSQLDG